MPKLVAANLTLNDVELLQSSWCSEFSRLISATKRARKDQKPLLLASAEIARKHADYWENFLYNNWTDEELDAGT